jgi:hypothetical protein
MPKDFLDAALLSVFLRPDAQIAQEVREPVNEVLSADPASVTVSVDGGW